jgi:hypothetical protein
MSKQVEVPYLNGKFKVQENEPNTLEELKALGFTEDEVVEGCVDDLRYRNKYPRVYGAVSKRLVESGFARAVKEQKENKDGTKKDILESTMDHIRRAVTEGDREEEVGKLFAEVAPDAPIYAPGEGRRGGGGKVSKEALEQANGFFAAGEEKVTAIADYIESSVPGYKVGRDGDDNATPESLARGIMALQKHLEAQAKKATANALAAVP